MAVKLKDVADKVGYSVGAVSQVLGNPDNKRFSQIARNRILAAAKEMGYVQNRLAARLRGAKTNLIAMILPWNTPEFMDSAEQAVTKAGYHFMVEFTREPTVEAEMEAIKRVLGWGVAGIIWAPFYSPEHYCDYFKKLSLEETKLVLLHENLSELPIQADYVSTDVVGGMQSAVEHLKQREYEELIYLSVGRDSPLRLRRKEAFVNSCGQVGVPSRIGTLESDPEKIQDQVRDILRGLKCRTGVICMSAWTTVDALIVAKSLGLNVPGDVGLIGIGDSLVGGHIRFFDVSTPSLSALREPQVEMAQTAVKLMFERIDSKQEDQPKSKGIVLKEKLVIRQST